MRFWPKLIFLLVLIALLAFAGARLFGMVMGLLENVSTDELEEVIDFCIEVGLPVTLAELGIKEVTEEKIMAVATAACAESDTLHNMPFEVTLEKVYAAILAADGYGRYYKGEE